MRLLLTVAIFLSFIFTPNVLAQTDRPSTKNKERIEANKLQREEKREEIKNKITTVKRERIRSSYGKMVIRIESITTRIEKLTLKIEERLQKISDSDENIDTTVIQDSLDKAKQILDDTKMQTSKLSDNLETMLASENPTEVMKNIKDSIKTIKDNLKEVHEILVSVIGDVKGLRVGENNDK